ncbi:hypothetical protein BDZ97DRAFT_753999 [Flammula alnicola]|nr:hypothetical protein BDZ97DRAFT_753999 [Flammula alnicola]
MSVSSRSQHIEGIDVASVKAEDNLTPSSYVKLPTAPLKRKHPGDEVGIGSRPSKVGEVYTKHEEHWAPDGNVLFQIGKVRFKVYRHRLASQSTWFRYLFDPDAGKVAGNTSTDEERIEKVSKGSESMDGIILYYLDVLEGPSADSFSELLKAMDAGISYAHDRPGYRVLVKILKEATFFRVPACIKFAELSIMDIFQDRWDKLTEHHSFYAADAVAVGRTYNIPHILRRAFYDLARSEPISSRASSKGGDTGHSGTTVEGYKDLKSIHPEDFIRLLSLQKEFVLVWDAIAASTKDRCKGCSGRHHSHDTVFEAKRLFPLDPILGIQVLLQPDPRYGAYCNCMCAKLRGERIRLWDNMKTWLDIEVDSD